MQRMRAASGIFVPDEAVGIPVAIPALVMAPHHRRDVPRKLHVGQHLLAGGRMLPNERPLFVRELARLVQHLGRNDQLADVVQQRADAEPEQRGLVEPAFAASAPARSATRSQ